MPDAVSYNNRACELLDQGRTNEAVLFAREAVRSDARLWQPVHTLALCFERLKLFEQAAVCFQKTLELNPRHAAARQQLVAVLLQAGRAGEAADQCGFVLERTPSDVATWCNLGLALRQLRRTAGAIEAYRRGLELAPHDSRLHWNLALALLAAGRFEEGWREYEWRVAEGIAAPSLRDEPLWHGEPLSGKSILLETEQGLGDTIQFLRYAPWLEQHGARVFVDCQLRLRSLLRRWIATSPVDYDYRAPLMSLPLITGVIPTNAPYLDAAPARLGPGFHAGLCYSGSGANPTDRFRSMPAEFAAPLKRVPGVDWISLQQKPDETLVETTAVLKSLDLVITVDTMIAHLAGAMGRPVWTLLSYSPDWRWMDSGAKTSWYPTMRLFRQPRPGDWARVIADVMAALRDHHPLQSTPN